MKTLKEAASKIDELQRRIEELERRPVYYPAPVYVPTPSPYYYPPTPWWGVPGTAGDWPITCGSGSATASDTLIWNASA